MLKAHPRDGWKGKAESKSTLSRWKFCLKINAGDRIEGRVEEQSWMEGTGSVQVFPSVSQSPGSRRKLARILWVAWHRAANNCE